MARYRNTADFEHATIARTGIILSNLGTPDSPDPAALRRYLGEFLSDPRVIEVPKVIWWFVLHAVILRLRPKKSAAAYRKIWTDGGSPLLVYSKKVSAAVQSRFDDHHIKVVLGMRYGRPSLGSALEELRRSRVDRLLLLPLYPQYSAATTASTFDTVTTGLQEWRWIPEFRMIASYHDNTAYIDALVESVRLHWARHNKPDKLLFSFHGLPKHYFLAGDPYHCQCHKTARLVAEQLELPDDAWQVTFQSRFGPREWLQPYTDKTLQECGRTGIGHVQVICPGFAVDCLETLEEIDMQNRELFLGAGGSRFSYIPALNDQAFHITALCKIIEQHIDGWHREDNESAVNLRVARVNKLQQE